MSLEDDFKSYIAASYENCETLPETSPDKYSQLRHACYAGMVIMWRRAILDLHEGDEDECVKILENIREQLQDYRAELEVAAAVASTEKWGLDNG